MKNTTSSPHEKGESLNRYILNPIIMRGKRLLGYIFVTISIYLVIFAILPLSNVVVCHE